MPIRLTAPARALPLCAACALLPAAAYANHGPGASGGGSSTISGETLKPNQFELTLREDFTQFQNFTPEQAAARARTGGDFDALRRSYITSLELSYGITPDLQVNLSTGYFAGERFISADREPSGEVETATGEPSGLLDTALTFKYRVYRGFWGNVSVISGIKAPTGRTDCVLSNGERLGRTDQPGTGSWDVPFGIAYSRFLTPNLTLDASTLYTLRNRSHGFDAGDRLDVAAALAYRLTDNIKTFPQYSIFGETLFVFLQKDDDHDITDPNSGSATLYFSPGFRVRFNEHVSFTIAPAIPIYQHVNGDQGKVDFKLAASFNFSF